MLGLAYLGKSCRELGCKAKRCTQECTDFQDEVKDANDFANMLTGGITQTFFRKSNYDFCWAMNPEYR